MYKKVNNKHRNNIFWGIIFCLVIYLLSGAENLQRAEDISYIGFYSNLLCIKLNIYELNFPTKIILIFIEI